MYPARIGLQPWQILRYVSYHGDAALLYLLIEYVECRCNELRYIDLVQVKFCLAEFHFGDIQDIVDQRQQQIAGEIDLLNVVAVTFVAQSTVYLHFHHFGEPVDGVERRAKFVTHIGKELGLRLVRLISRFLGFP